MGNFFQVKPNQEINRPLLRFLKTKHIDQITEVFNYLNDQYVSACTINLEEFQDIYSSFLQNFCDPVFQSLQNDGSLEGRVDIYESMALIVIFCMEEYTFKLQYLFDLFDFDQSQQIEKKELIITCQTTIRCICKIIGIPAPEIKTIEEYAKKAFISADSDQNQFISYKEFEFWVCQDYELQAFLQEYAGIQTFSNTDKRFKERLDLFEGLFEGASEGKHSIPLSDLSISLLQHVNNDQVPLLLQALTESSLSYGRIMDNDEDVIHVKSYNQIMMAWCSFDASDVNKSDTICAIELQFLLYAYEEQKFDNEYINQQLEIMDKDKSGDISRLEWLTFLNLIHDSGLTVFQGQMKKQFRKILQQNNSTISVEQFKDFVTSNYSMHVKDESNFNEVIGQYLGGLNQKDIAAWKQANDHVQSIIKKFPELERFKW